MHVYTTLSGHGSNVWQDQRSRPNARGYGISSREVSTITNPKTNEAYNPRLTTWSGIELVHPWQVVAQACAGSG